MKKNEEKNVNDKGFDPTFTIQSVPKSLLVLIVYRTKNLAIVLEHFV